ncbi:site-specific DNA-methyltransferase [Pseudoflavonifractor sp. 524-17]|uniref:DNA methyltransferase n=1 Tax=Pseudoflavonifractor sp. 524-17 TaxID=2304577 RepID=UPI00137B226C|nr:site-specific DNA-methyltransferase [Pseudoflavonifractor sp. 524-17]
MKGNVRCALYNDNFQNYKRYGIPKAQLVIADIPYNIGVNAYGSSPLWWKGGDSRNGASEKAGKAFFHTDFSFNIAEYFHFCNRLLKKEPKERNEAPCMVVFCSFEQLSTVIQYGEKYGFKHHIPLVFVKNFSPQVLKANMKIVGATEYGMLLYREKLPKFRNSGQMVFNWFPWERDGSNIPKIHPNQKPVRVLKRLIEVLTDQGDVVIDPCAGSGTTLRAAYELGRNAYGFEVSKHFAKEANAKMLTDLEMQIAADEKQETLFDLMGGQL